MCTIFHNKSTPDSSAASPQAVRPPRPVLCSSRAVSPSRTMSVSGPCHQGPTKGAKPWGAGSSSAARAQSGTRAGAVRRRPSGRGGAAPQHGPEAQGQQQGQACSPGGPARQQHGRGPEGGPERTPHAGAQLARGIGQHQSPQNQGGQRQGKPDRGDQAPCADRRFLAPVQPEQGQGAEQGQGQNIGSPGRPRRKSRMGHKFPDAQGLFQGHEHAQKAAGQGAEGREGKEVGPGSGGVPGGQPRGRQGYAARQDHSQGQGFPSPPLGRSGKRHEVKKFSHGWPSLPDPRAAAPARRSHG